MKYEKCLTCEQLGKTCDGPNFLAMESKELGQWCKAKLQQVPGITYDKVAADTGLSKSAVYGFLNGTHSDCRVETIRPIVKLVTGSNWDDNPCGNLDSSEKAQYESEAKMLHDQIKWKDKNILHLQEDNELLRTCLSDVNKIAKDRYALLRQKDRVIFVLSVLLFTSLLLIIWAIVVDVTDPTKGFFWFNNLLS